MVRYGFIGFHGNGSSKLLTLGYTRAYSHGHRVAPESVSVVGTASTQ